MKILNQIIFIIIVIFLIFIIKDNYKIIYSKTLSYLQSNNGIYFNIKDTLGNMVNSLGTVTNIGNDNNNFLNNTKSATSVAETPGALVVPDNFLTYDTESINLSSKDIIDITNKQRTLNGNLPILKENSKLDFSAEKKLQDMFVKGYFEHTSPDGVGVGDLADQIDYEYIVIGENLALGNFKNDQALVDAWMASPGHRANILNKRYTEIGVSVGKGIYNGKSVWMSVQHFGLPKSACPSIDQALKGVIDLDQSNIKAMETDMASKRAIIDSETAKKEGMTINSQIDSYNTLVKEYNKLILDIKNKVNTYNGEVHDFNNCIAQVN